MDGAPSQLVNPSVPSLPARLETDQKALHSAALLFLALVLGIFIELCGPAWAQAPVRRMPLHDVRGWATLLCALGTAIVLHEAGHLLPALAMNFELLGFSLGPFRAGRLHGRWSFHFSPRRLFSGSVSAVPRDASRWRSRMLIVVAGGPAATLLTGMISGLLLPCTSADSFSSSFLCAMTQISFFIFLLGLVPNDAKARVRNDARLFLLLLRGTEADEILLYHLVAQFQLRGVRPRDYPRSLIERLAAAQGRPDAMFLYAQTIASWAMDCGDLATTAAWNERAVELSDACEPRSRNLALANSACFDAIFGEDLESSRNKFHEVEIETLCPAWFMHRAKAAYWLTLGNVPEALAEVCRSEFAFPKCLPCYDFERSLLVRLHRKALTRIRASQDPRLESAYRANSAEV